MRHLIYFKQFVQTKVEVRGIKMRDLNFYGFRGFAKCMFVCQYVCMFCMCGHSAIQVLHLFISPIHQFFFSTDMYNAEKKIPKNKTNTEHLKSLSDNRWIRFTPHHFLIFSLYTFFFLFFCLSSTGTTAPYTPSIFLDTQFLSST